MSNFSFVKFYLHWNQSVQKSTENVHSKHDSPKFKWCVEICRWIDAGTDVEVEKFCALLKESQNSLSNKAESKEVNVEENNPEVIQDQCRLLENKNKEEFEDNDCIKDEERLNKKHLAEHGLKVAVCDTVKMRAGCILDPPWKE